MRLCLMIPLFALVACNTPHPEFRGVVAQRITIDGSTFDVRVRGERAEAIRVNAEYAPRFGPIRDRAIRAMEQVSGCPVGRIDGDQAQSFGTLDCDRDGLIAPPPPRPAEFECFAIDNWQSPGLGLDITEYDCAQV